MKEERKTEDRYKTRYLVEVRDWKRRNIFTKALIPKKFEFFRNCYQNIIMISSDKFLVVLVLELN